MGDDPRVQWVQSTAELALTVGPSLHQVPRRIADCLLGPTGLDVTSDPAADLITLEAELRATAADLMLEASDIQQRIAHATPDQKVGPVWTPATWRRRHARHTALVDAISDFSNTTAALNRVRGLLATLRSFVIRAEVPHGPLVEAARGWRRDPDRPRTVIVYQNEGAFLAADQQRTITNSRAFGEGVFGRRWRRDHEDDPRAPADRAGPWTIGFLESTGEIYATLRTPHHPSQVWLLGANLPADLANSVLENLAPRMPEPNSLILVVDTVRAVSGCGIAGALDPDHLDHGTAAPEPLSTTDSAITWIADTCGPDPPDVR